MRKKTMLSSLLLWTACFILNCTHHNDAPCPPCAEYAFKIAMLDSSGIGKLGGFSIRAINEKGHTFVANDTLGLGWKDDSTYAIGGGAGVYRLEITNPNYAPITLTDITVERGRCSIHTRILIIIPERSAALQKMVGHYRIITDSIGIGCGN
jgi:hypothetical protein